VLTVRPPTVPAGLSSACRLRQTRPIQGGYRYIEITRHDALLERAKEFISEGLESGALVPLISRTFKFDQIQEATRFLGSNEQIGKIVVMVD